MRWTFWLYIIPAVTLLLILFVYGLRSPWWRSLTGWAQVTLYAALLSVLTLATLLRVLHLSYAWAIGLSVAAMSAVEISLMGHLVNIIRLQRRDYKDSPNSRIDLQ